MLHAYSSMYRLAHLVALKLEALLDIPVLYIAGTKVSLHVFCGNRYLAWRQTVHDCCSLRRCYVVTVVSALG